MATEQELQSLLILDRDQDGKVSINELFLSWLMAIISITISVAPQELLVRYVI